mmetsp:Transcript_4264/g.8625  ORF Transcript_4264/g.8625 Transcript_4264/m.8625 type:complete len:82 (+) Transcript_4264:181-426(+)
MKTMIIIMMIRRALEDIFEDILEDTLEGVSLGASYQSHTQIMKRESTWKDLPRKEDFWKAQLYYPCSLQLGMAVCETFQAR